MGWLLNYHSSTASLYVKVCSPISWSQWKTLMGETPAKCLMCHSSSTTGRACRQMASMQPAHSQWAIYWAANHWYYKRGVHEVDWNVCLKYVNAVKLSQLRKVTGNIWQLLIIYSIMKSINNTRKSWLENGFRNPSLLIISQFVQI